MGIVILLVIIIAVAFLLRNKPAKNENYNYSVDDRYNLDKAAQEEEIDRILEKINKRGMASLTARERQLLDEYSKIKG
jgi:hypothetical protein